MITVHCQNHGIKMDRETLAMALATRTLVTYSKERMRFESYAGVTPYMLETFIRQVAL